MRTDGLAVEERLVCTRQNPRRTPLPCRREAESHGNDLLAEKARADEERHEKNARRGKRGYDVEQAGFLFPKGFADVSKSLLENNLLWQPLRLFVERLLVTYDWGEAFVALNLVLKPMIDNLFLKHTSDLALGPGDIEDLCGLPEGYLSAAQSHLQDLRLLQVDAPDGSSCVVD